jgi:hypothetical protein
LLFFQTDEAWNYYAGAAEMAALAQFMQVQNLGVILLAFYMFLCAKIILHSMNIITSNCGEIFFRVDIILLENLSLKAILKYSLLIFDSTE